MKFLCLFLLLFCGCNSSYISSENDLNQNSRTETANSDSKSETDILNTKSIKGIKGLLVLSENYNKPNDFIHFYNADNSLWYEFTYYYDDSDGKFEYENENFIPFAFHCDYYVLALKVTNETLFSYEVVVNEATGLRKYVRKLNGNLSFVTWEEHILKRVSSIDIDRKKGQLTDSPEGKLMNKDLSKISHFEPVEIKGDWLKVKCVYEQNVQDVTESNEFGWIRWKKDDVLLIDWFYFA